MKIRLLIAALLVAGATVIHVPLACAQGLAVLDRNKSNDPIEIEADDGIEWRQEDRVYIARGNVKVVRGDVTLWGDTVTAHYRDAKDKKSDKPAPGAKPPADAAENPAGGTEIWKIDAVGKVRIDSRGEQAFSDRAVYNVDLAVMTMTGKVRLVSPAQNTTASGDEAVYDQNQGVTVLTGKNLRFDSPETQITARDSLEYYDLKNLAVARGEAVAVQTDKRVRADILTAHLRPREQNGTAQQGKGPPAKGQPAKGQPAKGQPAKGQPAKGQPGKGQPTPVTSGAAPGGGGNGIERIDAFGNVFMSSPESIARGEKAVYSTTTGIAILTGAVKVTRGDNQMNGEMAEVNLNTGVSRMLSAGTPTNPGQRVRALFAPSKAGQPEGAKEQMSETRRAPPADDPSRPRLPEKATQ